MVFQSIIAPSPSSSQLLERKFEDQSSDEALSELKFRFSTMKITTPCSGFSRPHAIRLEEDNQNLEDSKNNAKSKNATTDFFSRPLAIRPKNDIRKLEDPTDSETSSIVTTPSGILGSDSLSTTFRRHLNIQRFISKPY
jgi:hypothetical protein